MSMIPNAICYIHVWFHPPQTCFNIGMGIFFTLALIPICLISVGEILNDLFLSIFYHHFVQKKIHT
jgi:hypothetical protein